MPKRASSLSFGRPILPHPRSGCPLGFRDASFPKTALSFARNGDKPGLDQGPRAAEAINGAFQRLQNLNHQREQLNNVADALLQGGSDQESVAQVLDAMGGLKRWQGEGYKPAERPFLILFVSYCRKNSDKVDRIVKIVQDCGWTVWIDRGELSAGDDWAGEIVRAIKRAKGVMWMGSKAACNSDNVRREIYLTGEFKKPFAPVLLEKIRMPDWLRFFLSGVQWLALYDLPDDEWPEAIRATLTRMARRPRASRGR
jgi:hypothetical protein